MKIEGSHTVPAPREVVYQKLLDPEVLAKALPGCEKLQANPDGSYQAELKIGVAGVKGAYNGRVEIADQNPPNSFRMIVNGQGKGGFLKGDALLHLVDASGGTAINYSGDVQVGGLIAAVGQRMIQGASRQILSQFFQNFAGQLQNQ